MGQAGVMNMTFGQEFCQNPHPQTTCFAKVDQKCDFNPIQSNLF